MKVLPAGEVERDLLLDNLLKLLRHYGFQQVLPPPTEERRVYFGHPELQRQFGEKILEVGGPPDQQLILAPTYFLNILKRYIQSLPQHGPHVVKWFYLFPLLQNQGERLEVVHELGVFILGEESSLAAAQLINGVAQLYGDLGLKNYVAEVNHLGCRICQKDYRGLLQEHAQKIKYELCPNCLLNLEQNILALWGCEQDSCRSLLASAPQMVDFLDESCRQMLVGVLETVDELGISYTLNPTLTAPFLQEKVIFRMTVEGERGASGLGVGGNYSSWAEYLGASHPVPLMGFLTTFERLWEQIPAEQRKLTSHVEVFMVPLGEVASRRAILLHRELQRAGIAAAEAILGHSGIKNQLKQAVEQNSDIALIIGQKEALEETVILRDMRSGIQEVFAADRIVEEVKKRLGR